MVFAGNQHATWASSSRGHQQMSPSCHHCWNLLSWQKYLITDLSNNNTTSSLFDRWIIHARYSEINFFSVELPLLPSRKCWNTEKESAVGATSEPKGQASSFYLLHKKKNGYRRHILWNGRERRLSESLESEYGPMITLLTTRIRSMTHATVKQRIFDGQNCRR